jgi:hypothetical protein
MALMPDDETCDDPGKALFAALREDAVQQALDDMEADTGLPRERVIAEAVKFAGQDRRAFLSHLRGRPPRAQERAGSGGRRRAYMSQHGVEMIVAVMFLLGALLAAIQIIWLM